MQIVEQYIIPFSRSSNNSESREENNKPNRWDHDIGNIILMIASIDSNGRRDFVCEL
jgi:hypothetical protein